MLVFCAVYFAASARLAGDSVPAERAIRGGIRLSSDDGSLPYG